VTQTGTVWMFDETANLCQEKEKKLTTIIRSIAVLSTEEASYWLK